MTRAAAFAVALILFCCACATDPRFLAPYRPSGKPTPNPILGYKTTFVVDYEGRRFGQKCPDAVLWVWGGDEESEAEPIDAELCAHRLKKVHIFLHPMPRRVDVLLFHKGEMIANDYQMITPRKEP